MSPELLATLARRLEAGWSIETATRWTPANPALGQCSVTALVVHELFGGEILKTRTASGLHFYNRIDGVRHDFTRAQFDREIEFEDLASDRDEAMADTSREQYELLLERVRLRKRPSARLLVLDPADRILLFHFRFEVGPLAGTSYWATPGGGVDPGESWAEAARRELREETGIDADVGGEIAVRRTSFALSTGEMVDAEERYFLVRTDGRIDITGNPDANERSFITAARWWTLDEIAASEETIFPQTISDMVEAGGLTTLRA